MRGIFPILIPLSEPWLQLSKHWELSRKWRFDSIWGYWQLCCSYPNIEWLPSPRISPAFTCSICRQSSREGCKSCEKGKNSSNIDIITDRRSSPTVHSGTCSVAATTAWNGKMHACMCSRCLANIATLRNQRPLQNKTLLVHIENTSCSLWMPRVRWPCLQLHRCWVMPHQHL